MPTIQEIQKIVEVSQVLFMDEIVEMPVVMKGKDVRIVKGMYPVPHIHEHLRYTNGYGKLRTSSRTT